MKKIKIDDNLPPITLDRDEDNDLTVEWIFPDVRIGMTICKKLYPESISGWYIVSKHMCVHGNLNLDLKEELEQ